jgi:hypothetical protein
MPNSTELQAAIQQEGFAWVPQFLPSAQLTELDALVTEFVKIDGNLRHLSSKVPLLASLAQPFEALLANLSPEPLFLTRSILFDKVVDLNWSVDWHQDLTISVTEKKELAGFHPWSLKEGIWHVQPPVSILDKMLTFRLHLDACTVANGPLRVLPGSHLSGRIPSSDLPAHASIDRFTECCCEGGDLLVMRPLLLHASSRSDGKTHRRVLHFEFGPSLESLGLNYSEEFNWRTQLGT